MTDRIRFSARLERQQHHHFHCLRWRYFAILLTLGEVLALVVMFKRADLIGAYTMGSYLTKESVGAILRG